MIKPDLSHIYDYEEEVFKGTFVMIDINVLYDEDHPEGYPDTLKCIEESKSSVNVFIDYFL